MSKKLIIIIIAVVVVIAAVIGVLFVTNKGEKNIEGSLEDIMTSLYAGISEDNLPMGLSNMEVNSENVESFIGTANVKYTEALANESMVGAIAHSVVLVRLEDSQDPAAAVEEIKNKVDPRKWICVEASNVVVKNKGNLVVLIMSNEELAPKLEANFDNL